MADQDWIPDSKCPIIPASGYYAVGVLRKPKMGIILRPDRSSRAISPGGVALVRICAVPPQKDRIDEAGYKTSGLYKPGDVVYAQMSLDMNSETIDWYDADDNKQRSFYLISEGRILGRCRYPDVVLTSHDEQEDNV